MNSILKKKKKFGKKVPVFYNKKNPNKNLVFVNNESNQINY